MKYYTYLHISKLTRKVFYIGKGCGDRLKSKTGRSPKWNKIVQEEGCEPVLLSYWESEKDAFIHEEFLISCFRDSSTELTNIHKGGPFHKGLVPSRAVICTSHSLTFKSCTDAADWAKSFGNNSLNRGWVSRLCKTGKISQGFEFRYADGTPIVIKEKTLRIIPVGKSNTDEPHISWSDDRNYFCVYFQKEKIRKYFCPRTYSGKDGAWEAALKYKYSLYYSIYSDVANKDEHFPLILKENKCLILENVV
jgi:hypothetical protein